MLELKPVQNYHFSNWAKTFECYPEKFFMPRDVDELREIILLAKESNRKIRIAGCGHSPNDLVCTDQWMISLKNFDRVLEIDQDAKTVKVECGIILSNLHQILKDNNLSLPIIGSVSDITLGGAISVATHGSSTHHKVISGYITNLEILSSSGDIYRCSEEQHSEVFYSALCGLGSIGILINATIQCEPSFLLHQYAYATSIYDFVDNIHDFLDTSYVKINWYPHTDRVLVLNSTKVYEVKPTQFNLIERVYQWILYKALGHYCFEFCLWISTFFPRITPLINKFFFAAVHSQFVERIGHSHEIMEMDCLFSQHVNEWSIPIEKTGLALLELIQLIETQDEIFAHFPIEIRFSMADKIYLSPSFGRQTCYINIIIYRPYGKEIPYQKFWNGFEQIMKKNDGRPHWAKAHKESGLFFRKSYPNFDNWVQTRKRMDPISMFTNKYIDRVLNTTI